MGHQQISVAVFCAVDEFLKSCDRFWQYPRNYALFKCDSCFSVVFLFISARRDTTRMQ